MEADAVRIAASKLYRGEMDFAIAGGTGTVGGAVVAAAQRRGHATRVIARGHGVDVRTGVGLEGVLRGADAVIDVLNVQTSSARRAGEFFRSTSGRLLEAEQRAGVPHHLVLSIVGVDRAPHGYYGAKLHQERAVADGSVPWTIQRVTQFHDFAAQMFAQTGIGPVHPAVRMRTQPVDVSEVAERLISLAEQPAQGRARDLAGPEEEDLAEMMRAWARHTGRRAWMPRIALPGAFGRALRDGSMLPGPDADRATGTFAGWLERQRQA
ncbi:SDR family oxidoreductase [Microbacterium sp. NPDC058345]|uniref:SDR family oxidoreductase n=1 Tax=Microbacterium sp. NPDC058345 TaxID=3346455 RepID=UPI00364BF315